MSLSQTEIILSFLLYSIVKCLDISNVSLPFESKVIAKYDHKDDLEFCSVFCHGTIHAACKCYKEQVGDCHRYQAKQQINFRHVVLSWANVIRNYVATGKTENKYLGPAADMNAISYDLGLEYVGMCTSINCVVERENCFVTKRFSHVSENNFVLYSSKPVTDLNALAAEAFNCWYEQMDNIKDADIIDGFYKIGSYLNFTTMIWATATHIGCTPATEKLEVGQYQTMLSCLYGSRGGSYAINLREKPVYLRGEPATKCRDSLTRNRIFSGLCGEIDLIPIVAPSKGTSNNFGYRLEKLAIVAFCLVSNL